MEPLITFDAGQTLIHLDLELLARRLEERAVRVAPAALADAAPAAWGDRSSACSRRHGGW